jgi:hypothetical protein
MTTPATEPAADIKHLRVKLRSAPEWNMPAGVARALIESMAQDSPALFGRHLQAALMGEMPSSPGRKRGSDAQ